MKCPKCSGVLVRQQYSDNIALHRCNDCCGIMLEPEILERIRAEVRADEFFDIGHAKVGDALDHIDRYDCPACKVPMVAGRDPKQIHIQFETCPKCRRLFLDAGELIDLSHETLMDKLRDIFVQITGRK